MSRLISVVWYKVFPAEFGGQKGIAEFTQYLSRFMPIHLLCSKNNHWNPDGFTVEPTLPIDKSQFIKRATYTIIERAILSQKATHLLLEHPYYGVHGVRLARNHNLKLIIRAHNIEFDRFRKLRKWWWPILFMLERYTLKNAQLTIFKTKEDRELAIRSFGIDRQKTIIAPIGITAKKIPSLEEKKHARSQLIQQHHIPSEHKILLFNGTLDYAPNARALKHLVKDILPRLSTQKDSYTLLVTGRNYFPEFKWVHQLSHPQLIQAGHVEDVTTYFKGADLFLNPVIEGGGIKVKLIEALSNNLPVISYASGAHGVSEEICGNKLSIIADRDVSSYVDAIIRQWDNQNQIPAVFFEAFHWESIVKEVAERIDML